MMSLRRYHAQRIYDSDKHWEFRRVHARIPVGACVYIYESGIGTLGVGRVTGEFTVGEVVYGTPDEVVCREVNLRSRQDAAAYLDGAQRATALRIDNPIHYSTPSWLDRFGLARPPQSYCRVTPEVPA